MRLPIKTLSNHVAYIMTFVLTTLMLCAHCQSQTPYTSNFVYTVAGNGTNGYPQAPSSALQTSIGTIGSVAFDSSGNMFFPENLCNCIREVSPSGTISVYWSIPLADGYAITSIAMDAQNNLYVGVFEQYYFSGASGNCSNLVGVYKVTQSGGQGSSSLYAGGGCWLNAPVDNSPAVGSNMGNVASMALDSSGNLYIADSRDSLVYEVANETLHIVAGNPVSFGGYSGDGGAATQAQLSVSSVTVFGKNLYIADANHSVIRMVSNGIINTIAGNYSAGSGFSGDGGPATSAQLNIPVSITTDAVGNLYIADAYNNVIREVSNGLIFPFVGTYPSSQKYTGSGVAARSFNLNVPTALAYNSVDQNIYFVDKNYYINFVQHPLPNRFH